VDVLRRVRILPGDVSPGLFEEPMKDTRQYFADGISVFERHGTAPIVSAEVIASCRSHRIAKAIANCLNLYGRTALQIKERMTAGFSAKPADEKGEHDVNQSGRDLSA
jgi:hypothetical protein